MHQVDAQDELLIIDPYFFPENPPANYIPLIEHILATTLERISDLHIVTKAKRTRSIHRDRTMDEQTRRGHLWKSGFKNAHAHEMDLFREYVDIVQDALDRVHASHVAYVQRQLSEEPDEANREGIEMFRAEDDERLAVVLPALSHSATIVSIFSFLEHEMFELCARLQKNAKHRIGAKDLAGNGIEQAANYLEKICGLSGLKIPPAWAELCKLQKVRNVIVHRRGMLKELNPKNDPDQAVRRYAIEKGLIADPIDTQLMITKEFCVEVIETVRSMLWILIHQVPIEHMAGEDPCSVKSK